MSISIKPANTIAIVLAGLFSAINPALAQTELLSIEFSGDDHADFEIWPSALSGAVSTADFPTDAALSSGTTTVSVSASSSLGTPQNRGGSTDGTPTGYSYQRLYEDLLIASGASGFLTLDFSGLNPSQIYQLTLYAWDPGATATDDKVWTVTGGTGIPASDSVNFQDTLVNNESFAMVFDITTTSSGTFQLQNTGGLSQSAINGFKLSAFPDLPPSLISPPQGFWDGGDEVIFEAVATGAPPLAFQWFLDGVLIAGADSATLTIPESTWQRDGDYTVRVTNASGSIDSDPVPVTIDIPEFPTREELTYEPIGPSSRRGGITLSEIHYHPAQRFDGRELEFIELYNSHPWPQDISGWRMSGDISYTFPEGTSIPANDYLVVARVPGDVEWAYGITGVAGPWVNNLPNTGGRIRLRKLSGAIVQEVNYDDGDPWPASADGAGHSLVMARPSFGEDDERAWEASHKIGGSPGIANSVPSDDLDHIFVSAALSNSEAPLEDYLELHNAAPFVVDLSGCFLSDARDSLTLFTIPSGVTIPAGGTLRYLESQLGFALSSMGDAIYLTDPTQTQVLDAVILPAASTNVTFSRGRGDALLQSQAPPSVVINEIMFHPPTEENADEWIEIHNPGASAQEIGGWAFTDGVNFTFPLGTQIPAGGFLVVTSDRVKFLSNHPAIGASLVIGDFSGSLSDGGERVELARPDGLGGFIPEDAVNFADSDRHHRFSDGRGATLERLDAGGDSNAASNWIDSDESAKSSWTTVEFTGTLAHGNTAASASQVQMFLMGAGEALVDNVEVVPNGGSNVLSNDDFEGGVGGWFFEGNHRDTELETNEGFSGSNSLKLIATRRGDTGPNRARAPLTQTLASGTQATLRARVRWLAGHPEFLLRLRGNWLEAKGILDVPTNLGTPGAVNSRAVANGGPDIDLVTHRPILPEASERFSVFAQVTDPDGVDSVTLRYRLDPATTTTDLVMVDDGSGVDLTANDGIFSARIPGQASGTLVAFQVIAEDANAATSVFPPNGEGLVRSGAPEGGPGFGNYRMWLTEADVADWDSQLFRSNNPYSLTFIYNDARPIYGAGAYYGGNKDSHPDPLSGAVSYDVELPSGDELLGAGKLTLDYPVRDATNQREQLIHWFADQLKLPTLHRRDIYLYMNGIRRQTIYHDAEQPDGVVTNSHFPGEDGELFKTANDNETNDAGIRLRPFVRNMLDVFEADGVIRPARYRWTTGARARGSRTRLDDTSIIELMERADDTSANYETQLLEIIDMDNWMRTFALKDLASFWDSFGNENWKNTYLYKQEAGKWVQFAWDFDIGLGVDGRDPFNLALFPTVNVDANIQRMYQTPAFIRSYWRAMEEALGSFFSGAGVTEVLDDKRVAYDAAGLNFTSPFVPSGAGLSIPNWIDQRAAFILPQLNAVIEPFAVLTPVDNSSTPNQVITISGMAPVDVALITVNGIALNLEWASESEWSASYTLQSGVNELLVTGVGTDGLEISSELRTVTFTGTFTWPQLVINEWLADNDTTLADPADGDFEDWIELFNSEATDTDLEGWFLSDDPADPFQFQVPAGYILPAGGFLLAWADNEIEQNVPVTNADLHLPFRLSASGESILLSAPDGTLVSRVDFGQQVPDKTEGQLSDGQIDALTTPSPGGINGSAAPAPTASFIVSGDAITFTLTTIPGFRYGIQASDDLIDWEPVGTDVSATGDTLEFTNNIDRSRRFYRFLRTP